MKFNFRIILFVCFVAPLCFSCSTNKISEVALLELTKPHEVVCDGNAFYVSDGKEGTKIHKYDIKNFKHLGVFGGSGEGKGLFHVDLGHSVGLDIRNDTLLISSHWKVSYFTSSGELIKEHPIDHDTFTYRFFGHNYYGTGFEKEGGVGYYTFNLYDQDFKEINKIVRIAGGYQEGVGIDRYTREYQILDFDERIYFKGHSDELEVQILDGEGNIEKHINRESIRLPMSEKHKNAILDDYKNHPAFAPLYEFIVPQLKFPDYLPAIHQMYVNKDGVYLTSYSDSLSETTISHFKRNGSWREYKNVPFEWQSFAEHYPFFITSHKLYQIVPALSKDKWRLTVVRL